MPPSKLIVLLSRSETTSSISSQEVTDLDSKGLATPSKEYGNSSTILLLGIIGTSLGALFILGFAIRFFRKFHSQSPPRKLSLKSETELFPDTSHPNQPVPDKLSTKLGSLSRAVRKPFRNSRGSFFKRHSTSGYDKDGLKKLDSFEDILWSGGGVSNKLGLTEVELSEILSANQANPGLGGTSMETQTTLPTDSWDQYMSILKHEEHLHFEDITPVASTTHSSADYSRHKHHPSLLSHYFHSTIGSYNRVEPISNTKPNSVNLELKPKPKPKPTRHFNSRDHIIGVSPNKLFQFPPQTTATVASGFSSVPPPIKPIKPPTPSLTSPSHNKDFNWNCIADNLQFITSPTALAPFRSPSKEVQFITPSPAKVNPSGFNSPHLVDPGRLSALIESSPIPPEPLHPSKSWDTCSNHNDNKLKV